MPAFRNVLLQKLNPQTLLTTGGIGLLAITSIAIAFVVIQLRTNALEEAKRNIGNLAFVLAEQTARSAQTIDLVLRDLQDSFRAVQDDSSDAFEHLVGSDTFHRDLKEKITRLPQAEVLAIVDSKGRLIATSRDTPISFDLSGRDYFKYFSITDDSRLFISAPVPNKGTGNWTVIFARRINSRSGAFLGVVLGGVPIKYFEDIYRSIDLPRKERFLLAKRDGTILLRHPTLTHGESFPETSPWHELVARGGGYYESPGYFDGTVRMVAVRPLHDFPLVVNAAVDKSDVLAAWRRQALYIAAGTILMIAYASFLMRITHRQFTRLREFSSALRRQNDDLKRLSNELRYSTEHLAKRSQELEATLETMDQGLIMVDGKGFVVQCNSQARRHLDLPADLMASRPPFSSVLEYQWNSNQSGREEHSFEEFSRKRTRDDHPYTQELKRPDGRVIEMHSIPMVAGGFVRTYMDITDRKAAEERVHYLAHHDDLTRLVNRVVFRDRLYNAMTVTDASKRGIALLYLDLDFFKQVNDTLGHDMGDRVLAEAARRMQASVRSIDTVARVGGDEFAIIVPFLEDRDSAENLAKRLVSNLAKPFIIDSASLLVGVSIGIAIHPDHGENVDELLLNADRALYNAKQAGRNTFRFHSAPQKSRAISA
jgi:diguanylate cyclase (GGDEF)-like protein